MATENPTFVVSPIEPADFDAMTSFTPLNGGDLTSASTMDHWPTNDADTSRRRYLWSLARQRALATDPAVRCMKAVDPQSSEIVATSLWHVYPDGPPKPPAPPAMSKHAPAAEKDDEPARARARGFPDDFPLALWEASMGKLYADRRAWMGGGRMWVLTQVQTREGWRRRGAGRALVGWGLEQARFERCPLYVEGAASLENYYKSLGFEGTGSEHRISRKPFGFDGDVVYVRMVANRGAAADLPVKTTG